MSAATAVTHRLGRGGVRRSAAGGVVGLCWRSLARCRAWRSAAVIGAIPIRGAGILHLLLAIVTSLFTRAVTVGCPGIKTPFLCSIRAPFLRPDLALVGAPWAGRVKAGRLRPPRQPARLGLDRASTVPDWRGRSGGTTQPFFCALVDRPC